MIDQYLAHQLTLIAEGLNHLTERLRGFLFDKKIPVNLYALFQMHWMRSGHILQY